MTPAPWYVAINRFDPDAIFQPRRSQARRNRYAHPDITVRRERTITPDTPITLKRSDWLCIKGKTARVVAYVRSADDALLVIAAPTLYVALLACHEAIRYPRGVTEGEWIILRKQVADVVCTLAPAFDGS